MSGPSSPPPQGYQPTGQGQADQQYQALAGQLGGAASSFPGMVLPGYQGVLGSFQNNPYYNQAQQGANQVAQQGAGVAGNQQMFANLLQQFLMGGGGQAGQGGGGQGYATGMQPGGTSWRSGPDMQGGGQGGQGGGMGGGGGASLLASLGFSGAGNAAPLLNQGIGNANTALGTAWGAIPGLTGGMGAANSILNTAFDPQSALYNRTAQNVTDQQNAINAMNGVQGNYAAGQTGQALSNFNIDWQNQQLGRQTQGLGAFTGAQSSIASNLTGLLGAGAQGYGSLLGSGLGAYEGLNQTAQSGYGSALQDLLSGFGGASDLSNQSLRTLLTSSGEPSSAFTANQDNILQGLNSLVSGYGSSLNPLSNAINAQGNYLNIGQGATGLAQNAWNLQNQANAQSMGGLGSLFGDIFGGGSSGNMFGGGLLSMIGL